MRILKLTFFSDLCYSNFSDPAWTTKESELFDEYFIRRMKQDQDVKMPTKKEINDFMSKYGVCKPFVRVRNKVNSIYQRLRRTAVPMTKLGKKTC